MSGARASPNLTYREYLESTHRVARTLNVPAPDRWVLTVPAIWDDEARSFMRHAAELAGLGGASPESDDRPSRLTLALEPEAAAIAAVPGVRPCVYFLCVGCA